MKLKFSVFSKIFGSSDSLEAEEARGHAKENQNLSLFVEKRCEQMVSTMHCKDTGSKVIKCADYLLLFVFIFLRNEQNNRQKRMRDAGRSTTLTPTLQMCPACFCCCCSYYKSGMCELAKNETQEIADKDPNRVC